MRNTHRITVGFNRHLLAELNIEVEENDEFIYFNIPAQSYDIFSQAAREAVKTLPTDEQDVLVERIYHMWNREFAFSLLKGAMKG